MVAAIKISVGGIQIKAELNDSATARAIVAGLPITAKSQRWGEEIYFAVPVKASLEEGAREVVEPGTLGYWPCGEAFCMFWGPTPASRAGEIRAASPVNIVGTMFGDFNKLVGIRDGDEIRIELY